MDAFARALRHEDVKGARCGLRHVLPQLVALAHDAVEALMLVPPLHRRRGTEHLHMLRILRVQHLELHDLRLVVRPRHTALLVLTSLRLAALRHADSVLMLCLAHLRLVRDPSLLAMGRRAKMLFVVQ